MSSSRPSKRFESCPLRSTNFSRKRFGSEREYLPSSLIYEQLSEHFEVGVHFNWAKRFTPGGGLPLTSEVPGPLRMVNS